MPIKIYGLPLQHNYVAIHATCKLSGIEEEFVMTDIMAGDQFKTEYVTKFPMHCCPAMEDTENGLCVTETNAILRYCARKGGKKLYPDDLKQATIVDMVMDHKLCTLGKTMAEMFIYPKAGFGATPTDDQLREKCDKLKQEQWPAVQKYITESKGPFICGDQITIADITIWGHAKLVSILQGTDSDCFNNCDGMKAWFEACEGKISAEWFSDANWGFWQSKK